MDPVIDVPGIYRRRTKPVEAGEVIEFGTNRNIDNNENWIALFDQYINDKLNDEEKQKFEQRLRTDKKFLHDFRLFLFALNGICKEAEQENIEFGTAIKNISKAQLFRAIEHIPQPSRHNSHRKRTAWIASIVAILMVGIFTVLSVYQSGLDKVDDAIVAFNYVTDSKQGNLETITSTNFTAIKDAYTQTIDSDNEQEAKEAGMRLAMACLKMHDRKRAKGLLQELSTRFADDTKFTAQCHKILELLD